jgi:hypothetical protein
VRGRHWVWRRRRQVERVHGREGAALAFLRGFLPSLVIIVLSFSCETVAKGGSTDVVFEDDETQRSTGPGLVAIDSSATLELVGIGDTNGDEDGPGGCGMWREE